MKTVVPRWGRGRGRTAPFTQGVRGEEGLTLIEAIFALVILTIGLLALFALHQAALSAAQLSFRMSESTILAQDMMDQLNAAEYTRNGTNTALNHNDTDSTDADNPLIDLANNFTGTGGGKVNCLAQSGGGGGMAIYTPTYSVEPIAGDTYGRTLIKARVTFQMSEAGVNLHGVTLAQTRSYDRYQ